VQGTVKAYDEDTKTGSLVTDDRQEIAIDPSSLAEELRMLRLGQRVRFEVEESDERPVARGLRLVTFE
jgi:cold shock CspA family protein